MKISSNFNRLYWGAIINDVLQNLKVLKWNNIEFNTKRLGKDGLHELFKIITFNNKSLTDMESKEVVEYLEDIRVILADNGYTLTIDNEEWNRIMRSIHN